MRNAKVPLFDLINCLSDAMDFISPEVVNHHKQVSYIAFSISSETGLSLLDQKELILAGSMHDIGAFSLKTKLDILEFEMINPHRHAEQGYRILKLFEPLSRIAPIVRFHHVPWDKGRGTIFRRQQVPFSSQILHLADRISILLNRKKEVLGQVPGILKTINSYSGTMFHPELVDAFKTLSAREYFWLDLVSPSMPNFLLNKLRSEQIALDKKAMISYAKLFSFIIDFKSPFTATHSSGVAVTAESLSDLMGFSDKNRNLIRIAGYLHDLGKLAVPVEILDKPAKLVKKEFDIIRHHAFYTYRLLETIPALRTVNSWASLHHERLNGTGYPFRLSKKNLPIGSQIMAVADIFTALTENRPYRKGMTMENTLTLMDSMTKQGEINGDIVSLLKKHYRKLNTHRLHVQSHAAEEYRKIKLPPHSSYF